ncbi:MAG: hypothetical protein LIV11_09555 [Bacillota bacterium]|nr:hypothetical protein [Bacillota bacterium]
MEKTENPPGSANALPGGFICFIGNFPEIPYETKRSARMRTPL